MRAKHAKVDLGAGKWFQPPNRTLIETLEVCRCANLNNRLSQIVYLRTLARVRGSILCFPRWAERSLRRHPQFRFEFRLPPFRSSLSVRTCAPNLMRDRSAKLSVPRSLVEMRRTSWRAVWLSTCARHGTPPPGEGFRAHTHTHNPICARGIYDVCVWICVCVCVCVCVCFAFTRFCKKYAKTYAIKYALPHGQQRRAWPYPKERAGRKSVRGMGNTGCILRNTACSMVTFIP